MLLFRSDVVREIMFLMSSVRDGEAVNFGDDVEFTIQTRNGKESAVDISKLPTVRKSVMRVLWHSLKFSSYRGLLFSRILEMSGSKGRY